jgi:hypothetical protein
MVAVALVAIALAVGRAYQLSSISASYVTMARSLQSMALGFRIQAADPKTSPGTAADFLRKAEEMEEVARIYERASTRPWLPVTFKPRSP